MNNLKVTRKFIFFFIGILLLNFASATDIAYIVTSGANQNFINAINETGLTYTLIPYAQISTTNFSAYRMILLDNDYFPNWQNIPVNNISALIVNGRNIVDWGWAKRISTSSQTTPIKIDVSNCTNSDICGNLSGNVQAYSSSSPSMYYLDNGDAYSGLQMIASTTYDNKDAVIALAQAGSVLTYPGKPNTTVKGNSIFFGLTKSAYWTNNTKQLFKNSLLWVNGKSSFDIEMKQGQNLVSFPLIINFNLSEILSENSEIISIKEYNNGLVNVTQVANNKGYFIEASGDFVLTITGDEPRQAQNVSLNQGMNLIGISSLSNMSLDDLNSGIIEVVKRNEDGGYNISTKYNGSWFNSFELEPGKGYWFKTEIDEVIWNYNP